MRHPLSIVRDGQRLGNRLRPMRSAVESTTVRGTVRDALGPGPVVAEYAHGPGPHTALADSDPIQFPFRMRKERRSTLLTEECRSPPPRRLIKPHTCGTASIRPPVHSMRQSEHAIICRPMTDSGKAAALAQRRFRPIQHGSGQRIRAASQLLSGLRAVNWRCAVARLPPNMAAGRFHQQQAAWTGIQSRPTPPDRPRAAGRHPAGAWRAPDQLLCALHHRPRAAPCSPS